MSDHEESPMVGTEPGEEPIVMQSNDNAVAEEATAPIAADGARLFLGNLPGDWEEKNIEELLQKFGTASDVKVARPRGGATGVKFGFATMESAEIASAAVAALHETTVSDMVIKVEISKPRERQAPKEKGGTSQEICRQFASRGSCVRGDSCQYVHKEGGAPRRDRGGRDRDRRDSGRDRDRDRDRDYGRRDRDRSRDRDRRDFGRDRGRAGRDDRDRDRDRRDSRDFGRDRDRGGRDYDRRDRSRSRSRDGRRGNDRSRANDRSRGGGGDRGRGGDRSGEVCHQFERSGSCVRGVDCKFIHIDRNASSGGRGSKPATALAVGSEVPMDDRGGRGRSRSNSGERRW